MELEETINNLQEYIDLDRKMRTSPMEEWSDFDKFCELHCRYIEKALHYIKEESIPKVVVEEKIKVIQERFKEETRTDFLITLKILENELQEILTKGEKKNDKN